MKKIFTATSIAAIALASVAYADNKNEVSRSFDLTDFDAIHISGVYELDVTVGGDFSIELSGADKEMERVRVSVRNNALHLSQGKNNKRRSGNRRSIHAVISLPSLNSLDVSGVVDGEVSGIDASTFELDISGVGDMELSGECGSLEADVSGVGDLDARALECAVVDVDVSGVGSASVYASEEVDASVSGMGDIDIYGKPESVTKNKNLFADITVH